ncbi:hypothetical protein QUF80_17860 [Desulfococcaceae bacterium HSG8]|nr:hypothetical protein [Desulfococcaceae bacterium HSG8]
MNADTDTIKTIFWVIVIIFWVLSSLVKFLRKKDKSKPGPPPLPRTTEHSDARKEEEKKSPVRSLKEGLANFFEEIVMAQNEGFQKILPVGEAVQKSSPSVAPDHDAPAKPAESDATPAEVRKPASEDYYETEKVSVPAGLDLSGEGLRRAVVFSEILGPPVALRGDDNRLF